MKRLEKRKALIPRNMPNGYFKEDTPTSVGVKIERNKVQINPAKNKKVFPSTPFN